MQTTVKKELRFCGTGLHTGAPVRMWLRPAPAEHGIWFRRTDAVSGDAMIAARWNNVQVSPLCTRIENADGVSVSTIEHIMAALAGCGVHNALVELDGPEVPIMDGSSARFVRDIVRVGLRELDAPLMAIEILKPVEVRRDGAMARIEPASHLQVDFSIDFDDAAIGQQHRSMSLANGAFVRDLCDSRTFCRQSDVDSMRSQGLARGGSLSNAVVVDGKEVLTPGGLRHKDEAVRHKILDALGDLATAGMPILGRYVGDRSGHAMTNNLLRSLFAAPDAYRIVLCDTATAALLPGVGVRFADLPAVA